MPCGGTRERGGSGPVPCLSPLGDALAMPACGWGQMNLRALFVGVCALTTVLALWGAARKSGASPASEAPARIPPPTFTKDVVPFLTRHCYACHGNGKKRGKFSLEKYQDEEALQKDRQVWENVLQMVRSGEMPPKERPRPAAAEVEAVLRRIEGVLADVDCTEAARPRPRHAPPAQPDRVQQHHPRPGRRRFPTRRRLPQRRRRLRLRQHRRRPVAVAAAAGKIPRRRRKDRRQGHRHRRHAAAGADDAQQHPLFPPNGRRDAARPRQGPVRPGRSLRRKLLRRGRLCDPRQGVRPAGRRRSRCAGSCASARPRQGIRGESRRRRPRRRSS